MDLFAGPGRARVSTSGELEDGSPLVALKQPVPFTKVVLCELDVENVESLKRRVAGARVSVEIAEGDCNETMDRVVAALPEWGLNVTLVDPYNLAALASKHSRGDAIWESVTRKTPGGQRDLF